MALAVVLCVAVVRLLIEGWWPQYQLAGDEAQYWDWSRRLDWSYYTKGPGVAWAIAASVRTLGEQALAVRLPSLAAWVLTAWAVGAMARRTAWIGSVGGEAATRRLAFAAGVLAFVLCPAMAGAGQFATIDMPYLACWALGVLAGLSACRSLAAGHMHAGAWLGVGVAVGASFLFKYTALLVLPGLVWMTWRAATLGGEGATRRLGLGWVVGGAALLAATMPVWWWNHVHGWPTVAHLLGHLHAEGGDVAETARPWTPLWLAEYVGLQLLIVGPGLWVLFAGASITGWRREANNTDGDDAEAAAKLRQTMRQGLVVIGALPLAFYAVVSLRTDAEANWPIAGYVTLLALVGAMTPWAWQRYDDAVSAWEALPRPRPKRGVIRKRPETWWQVGRDWAIGYGIAALVGVTLGPTLVRGVATLPGVSNVLDADRALRRVTGHEQWANAIHAAVHFALPPGERDQVIWAADRYGDAALLAFYLPHRPSVHSIESLTPRGRESSYDYFADTNLWRQGLEGKTMIAVGGSPAKWQALLRFDALKVLDAAREAYLLEGYRGPVAPPPEERVYAPGIDGR